MWATLVNYLQLCTHFIVKPRSTPLVPGGGLLFGARMIESGTYGVHSADPPMIPGYTAIARGLGYLYCHPIPAYVKLLHTA